MIYTHSLVSFFYVQLASLIVAYWFFWWCVSNSLITWKESKPHQYWWTCTFAPIFDSQMLLGLFFWKPCHLQWGGWRKYWCKCRVLFCNKDKIGCPSHCYGCWDGLLWCNWWWQAVLCGIENKQRGLFLRELSSPATAFFVIKILSLSLMWQLEYHTVEAYEKEKLLRFWVFYSSRSFLFKLLRFPGSTACSFFLLLC